MADVILRYYLSEVGRRASLAAGGDGRREQEVALADAPADILEIATVDPAGRAVLLVGGPLNGDSRAHDRMWDSAQAPQDLAAWEIRRRETYARLRSERREAAVSAYLKLPHHVERQGDLWLAVEPGEDARGDAQVERLYSEALENAEVLNQRDQSKRTNERKLKNQIAFENVRTWVEKNGSPWLRKMQDLGMLDRAMGKYTEERLALERPGWRYEAAQFETVLVPTEAELDALAAARETVDSSVELRHRVEHLAECRLRNERCKCGAPRQGVLIGVFLGKQIVKEIES